eukprot:CAMPEP_0119141308 /NCGR_PEP_ID=MMETSP1310-20130426/30804_1 /TAXON_ID=464262 /ORGANISM="Genus nov. species nov., Strain RCC2339" /LENGTH=62 /DNA_ID=CAMNT_0007132747 /DNA_START=47 /DNA_END=235 /DNA_ORIENTATION=+
MASINKGKSTSLLSHLNPTGMRELLSNMTMRPAHWKKRLAIAPGATAIFLVASTVGKPVLAA